MLVDVRALIMVAQYDSALAERLLCRDDAAIARVVRERFEPVKFYRAHFHVRIRPPEHYETLNLIITAKPSFYAGLVPPCRFWWPLASVDMRPTRRALSSRLDCGNSARQLAYGFGVAPRERTI